MNEINEILKDRGNRYGEFKEHARITQSIKTAMIDSPNWSRLSPDKRECLEMIAHKVGRVLNGDSEYIESWRDMAGYISLIIDSLNKQEGATDGRVILMKVIDGKLVDAP